MQSLKQIDDNGFTLIEVLMVIAIISILTAIVIPNLLAYRQQSFCAAVEQDANNLSIALHSYFSSPTHTTLTGLTPAQVGFDSFSGFGSQRNIGTITGTLDNIIVQVTDGSGNCSGNRPGWFGHVYTKVMK